MKVEIERDSVRRFKVDDNEFLRMEANFPQFGVKQTVEVSYPATKADIKTAVEIVAQEVKAVDEAQTLQCEKDAEARAALGLGGTKLKFEVDV